MFEKVNIPDCIVVMLGYIGGTVKTAVHQKGEKKQ